MDADTGKRNTGLRCDARPIGQIEAINRSNRAFELLFLSAPCHDSRKSQVGTLLDHEPWIRRGRAEPAEPS